MRLFATLLGAALLTTAAAGARGARTQDQAQIERGQKVYVAQKCGTCHSIDGKGNRKGPLDDVGSKLTEEELRLWIVDAPAMTAKTNAARKPPMKSYKLPEEDLDALVAYMRSLKKG